MAWDIIRVNHARQHAKLNAGKWREKVKMAESKENLSNIQSEDEEIARILDGRYAKNTIRQQKML